MKNFFTLLFLTVFFLSGFSQQASASGTTLVSERLNEQIQTSKSGDLIRVNIILNEQFDVQQLIRNVESMEREERRDYVVSVLKQFASISQKAVVEKLTTLERNEQVRDVNALWVANVINCYATPEAIAQLDGHRDIELIDHDAYQIVLDPAERKDAFAEIGDPESREITWNVTKINAPQVWALGYDGEGVVVAVIDTGVNYNHIDLVNNMWEHPDFPYHGWNYVNNSNNPMDDQGHGTHCAGTVAGDGAAGSQTGIAPGAKIMVLKVLDSGGGGNQSSVWSSVQFSIENGAHVLSLSLGWQHSWGPNRTAFRQAFDSALAAGLVASVAAGNEGDQQGTYPIPDNVRTPGDCPPPWLHPDQTLVGGISSVICVGATNNNDALAGFSGRGPLTWSAITPYNDYAYQPGMGLIRPDISAPGVSIKSLAHYSNTGYESGWSGTSMATPAAAGVMALMLQKNMGLTPAQISQILEETTVVLSPGKNNNSGSGRVDALAAVEAVSMPGPSYYSHTFTDPNSNETLEPGESVLMSLTMANFSDEAVSAVTVNLSTDSEYITITDGTEYFGDFALESIIEIEDAFAFDVANNIPGGEVVKFFVTAVSGDESWESSFTVTAHGVTFATGTFTINDTNGNGNGNLDPGENVNITIQINNLGQIAAPNVVCTLTSPSSEITINNGSFTIPNLNGGQSSAASFNITVSPDAPIGTIIDMNLHLVSGYYELEAMFYPKVGLIVEDFETGDFSQYDWEFAGNSPWTIVSTGVYEGLYSAKSGSIGNNASSQMKVTMDVSANDSIAFFRKVSSESDYDFLEFYIDNNKVGSWSGEVGWGRVSYPVTAGTRTFRWVYTKDIFVVSGQDCGWIDYIEFPAVADQTMTVNAGEDVEICAGMNFQTTASAQNYASLVWETSGTGTFNNSALLNAIYTPSQADWDAGNVTLSLTVYGAGGEMLTDAFVLSFMALPAQTAAITGPATVCMGFSEYFHTNIASNATWYEWELVPESAGTFSSSDTIVMITFEAGFTGTAMLKVRGMNVCGEGEFSEEFLLQIDDCTGINEGIAGEKFSITPNPNNGSFMITFAGDFKSANTIKILDTKGQTVFVQHNTAAGRVQLDAGSLENGFYFIVIENEHSKSIEKLIINK